MNADFYRTRDPGALYQGTNTVLVHPAALRPIPIPLTGIAASLGVLFLLAALGVSRQSVDLSISPDDVSFDVSALSFHLPVSPQPLKVTSVRSNTVTADLYLVAEGLGVGDHGSIYFKRPDGKLFPVVRSAYIERPALRPDEPTSVFLSGADSALLMRLSSAGFFIWKPLAANEKVPARAERNADKLLAVTGVPVTDVAAPAVTPESIIWFPGEMESFVLLENGTIQRILANGQRVEMVSRTEGDR